jgi:hypothetical protein
VIKDKATMKSLNLVVNWTTLMLGLFVMGLFLVNPAQAMQSLPKRVQLNYALEQGGQLIGHAEEIYTQTGVQYRIKSITKGVGVYALLGKRQLISEGTVGKAGLQPSRFESLQPKHPSKSLINAFDWKQNLLRMQVKGEAKQVSLESGTQDLLSVMYQFMHVPPHAKQVVLPVTTGKRLKRQHFNVSDDSQQLSTAAGRFAVLTLSDAESGDKTIYLAKDKYFLPVKIVMKEHGATIEQTLVSIQIE